MVSSRAPVTAIIPDGNRRWARLRGVELRVAYLRAVREIALALDYLLWTIGSPAVYVYSSSLENCVYREGGDARAIEEVASSAGIEIVKRLEAEGVHVYFYGFLKAAPTSIVDFAASRLLESPPKLPAVIILTCYSFLAEARNGRMLGVDPQAPQVDLVYRSGGERRLSGFPPLLVTYAELYFDDKYWPDAGAKGVAEAVNWFRKRSRRFGR